MAGVKPGTKRGPYAKRIPATDLTQLEDADKTPALEIFLNGLSNEKIVALRKAAKVQRLTSREQEFVDSWLARS